MKRMILMIEVDGILVGDELLIIADDMWMTGLSGDLLGRSYRRY